MLPKVTHFRYNDTGTNFKTSKVITNDAEPQYHISYRSYIFQV